MTKGYTILKLNDLEFLTRILRACPQITFETANLINKTNANIVSAIAKYQEKGNLLSERYKEIQKTEGDTKDAIEALKTLNSEEFKVEVYQLKSELFKDISGEKEYPTQEGAKTFSYREAYFGLLGMEIITE